MDFTNEEVLINSLLDAGCNKEQIEMAKRNLSNQDKIADILVDQRKMVLDKIHADEAKMKCIDYLIYNLKKEEKRKNP